MAIALISKPRILIVDGAFDGLDADASQLACKLIEQHCLINQATAIVCASKMTEDLRKIATHVCTVGNRLSKTFFTSFETPNTIPRSKSDLIDVKQLAQHK